MWLARHNQHQPTGMAGVAVLLAGSVRTLQFRSLQEKFVDFLSTIPRYSTFAVLSLTDSRPHCHEGASRACIPIDAHKTFDHIPFLSALWYRDGKLLLNSGARWRSAPASEQTVPASLTNNTQVMAWWTKWWSANVAWRLLLSFERTSRREHKQILYLRPDLVFFAPMPRSLLPESTEEVVVPSRHVFDYQKASINDDVVFGGRYAATIVLNTVNEVKYPTFIHTNAPMRATASINSGDSGSVLRTRLERFNISVKQVDVAYTIMRPCDGQTECWRVGIDHLKSGRPTLDTKHARVADCKRSIGKICEAM